MLRIVDVILDPQHVLVGESVSVSIKVSEGNWNAVKGAFINWQELKDTVPNWEEVKKT